MTPTLCKRCAFQGAMGPMYDVPTTTLSYHLRASPAAKKAADAVAINQGVVWWLLLSSAA